MVRARMPIQFIEDDRRRKATFIKRMMGIKKKAKELSKLCDIPVLLICYGPLVSGNPVETWPENAPDILEIVEKYGRLSPEDRNRRKDDLNSYIRNQTKKVLAEREKIMKANTRAQTHTESSNPWEALRKLESEIAIVDDRIAVMKAQESMKIVTVESEIDREDDQTLHYLLNDGSQGCMGLDTIMARDYVHGESSKDVVQVEPLAQMPPSRLRPDMSGFLYQDLNPMFGVNYDAINCGCGSSYQEDCVYNYHPSWMSADLRYPEEFSFQRFHSLGWM